MATALNSPAMANDIQECTQFLDAGLEPSAKKVEEIFTKAADIALVEAKDKKVKHPYKHKQKPKK